MQIVPDVNILVILGDDIGITNLRCYSKGVMGYHTPNIDRIANESMVFTDYYGEQSCTAGRASFITGQTGFRTGLTKVGLPGVDLGMRKGRSHNRPGPERTGLWDGTVRQESSWGQRRAPSHAQAMVGQFLQTFVKFPPRQKVASFSIDQVVDKLTAMQTSGK